MNISDRFTDYGITGAFFLLGQLILLAFWGLEGWINAVASVIQSIPQVVQPTAISLLVAFAIIGIFFFGLMLDLAAIIKQELPIFKEHMQRNQLWLQEFMLKFPHYFPPELSAVLLEWFDLRKRDSTESKQETNLSLKFIHGLQSLWRWFSPIPSFTEMQAYFKLRNLIFSFPLIYSAGTQFDNLSDGGHLWRTSRALFTASVFLAGEATVRAIVGFLHPRPQPFPGSTLPFIVVWLILIGFSFMSWLIARNSFSRMCYTAFSLTYLTYSKNIGNSSGQSNPSKYQENVD